MQGLLQTWRRHMTVCASAAPFPPTPRTHTYTHAHAHTHTRAHTHAHTHRPQVVVLKQKIWVKGVSYELQEIYGMDSVTGERASGQLDGRLRAAAARIAGGRGGGSEGEKEGGKKGRERRHTIYYMWQGRTDLLLVLTVHILPNPLNPRLQARRLPGVRRDGGRRVRHLHELAARHDGAALPPHVHVSRVRVGAQDSDQQVPHLQVRPWACGARLALDPRVAGGCAVFLPP